MAPRAMPFPDLAASGANDWWRYLAVIVIVVAGVVAVGFVIVIILALLAPQTIDAITDPARGMAGVSLGMRLIILIAMLATIVVIAPLTLVFGARIHRRPKWTFVTARGSFDWPAWSHSFVVTVMVMTWLVLFGMVLQPSVIELNFDPRAFFLFLPVVLLLVPVQAFAEEVFFRGYLTQGVARLTGSFALRLAVPAVLFTSAHAANTEFQAGGAWAILDYALIAFYLGYLALRGGGLEHAAGLHAGLNVTLLLMLTHDDASVSVPAVFRATEVDYAVGAVGTLLLCLSHYYLVGRKLSGGAVAEFPALGADRQARPAVDGKERGMSSVEDFLLLGRSVQREIGAATHESLSGAPRTANSAAGESSARDDRTRAWLRNILLVARTKFEDSPEINELIEIMESPVRRAEIKEVHQKIADLPREPEEEKDPDGAYRRYLALCELIANTVVAARAESTEVDSDSLDDVVPAVGDLMRACPDARYRIDLMAAALAPLEPAQARRAASRPGAAGKPLAIDAAS